MKGTLKEQLRDFTDYNHMSKGLVVSDTGPNVSFKTTNRVKLIRHYANGEEPMSSNRFQRAAFSSCGMGYMYNQTLRVERLFGQKTTYLQFGNPYVQSCSVSKYSHNRTNTEHELPALNNSALQSKLILTNNMLQCQTREPVKRNENFTLSLYGVHALKNAHDRRETDHAATDIVQQQMMRLFNMMFNQKNKKNHEFPGTSTVHQTDNVHERLKYFLMQYHRCNRFNIQRALYVNIKDQCLSNECMNAITAYRDIVETDRVYETAMNMLDITQSQFPTKKQKIRACYMLHVMRRVRALRDSQRRRYNVPLDTAEGRATRQFVRLVFRCMHVPGDSLYTKKKKNSCYTNGTSSIWLKQVKRPCSATDAYLGHIKRIRRATKGDPEITNNNGCEPYDFNKWLDVAVKHGMSQST